MIAQMVERRTVEVKKVFRWPGVRITLARYIYKQHGDVAQMVERPLSMREVGGSMPLVSTSQLQSGQMRQT